jgi:2-dehydropantoate 2-reductase
VKVAVYGAGAVGGYFGGRLAQAGAFVQLIARGRHLEALKGSGLRVRSVRGDFQLRLPATDDPAEVGPCDVVLFCVKSFDTEAAAARLASLLAPQTAVLSLQNGVDNEEKIAREVGWEHVLGGAAYIFATVTEPGLIADTGGPGRIVFGEWDGSHSSRVRDLLEWFRKAQVDAEASSDIQSDLWYKFAFICAQAGMTAATRLPIGRIRSEPESWAMFQRLLEEVYAVAAAVGVRLPADTVQRHLRFAEGLEPHGYSSLHDDLAGGRRLELEALHGTVVRLGREHGVEVPASQAVHAILKPWESPPNER